MTPCAYPPCGIKFTPTRCGHRFHSDACRAAWHREQTCPGKISSIRALKRGGWAFTVHYPNQPGGLVIGSVVRLETGAIPRSDANLRDYAD